MRSILKSFKPHAANPEEQPLRSELFSTEQLQRHATDLAQQHRLAPRKGKDHLLPRLAENEKLLQEFNKATLRAEERRRTTPAADWLIDNCYLIEEQIRTARRHFPRSYSRELPHLERTGHPRVHDLALEFVTHVDGRIDAAQLSGFIAAYQSVTKLKLGELWAIPIMLRLALIENLRRVAVLLSAARKERDRADEWADRLVGTAESDPARLIAVVGELAAETKRLTRAFVAEFYRRLHQKTATLQIAFGWVEHRLAIDGRTIEQLVQNESQDQAANQVSVANSVNSLRTLDAIDWAEFVETLSAVEQTLRRDPSGIYGRTSFQTRDACRHAVERIAQRCPLNEWDVAARAVDMAGRQETGDPRAKHVGFFLVDEGVARLEAEVAMRMDWTHWSERLFRRRPLLLFLGSILLCTALLALALLSAAAAAGIAGWGLFALAVPLVIGASQLAVSIVNWLATLLASPRLLPRMDYSEGIPADHSTMIVVPTMLTSATGVDSLVEDLEIRYLANRDPNLFFALLTDFRDAPAETQPEDEELLRRASEGIRRLNERYPKVPGSAFFLFHRPRQWNATEGVWMGYERKRGKLVAFNGLLRGRNRECFSCIVGELARLPSIKYVITLDTDTQLPRDAARELVGAMAHPLNRPQFDPAARRVTHGYGVLQPRVAVNMACANRTRFARLFCGDPGLDPYTRAVSDVYQDLFQEGSFIGKGIYDVDTFEQALAQTLPANRILSHDLLESGYVRSGLISDVQLFEEYPSQYMADVHRRHRWIRGDWQIWNWAFSRVPAPDGGRTPNPLSALARWKIFDNLRRSLVPVALLVVLILAWIAVPGGLPGWVVFVVLTLGSSVILSASLDLLHKPRDLFWSLHLRQSAQAAARHAGQALCAICFLPFEAFVSLDAVLRTLGRLIFTHRNLLEWQTASDAARSVPRNMAGFGKRMWFGPALGIGVTAYLAIKAPGVLVWAAPLLGLWIASPVAAWWISRPVIVAPHKLSDQQLDFLDQRARKTWRFFETFVTEDDNWLPPDNFQEQPGPIVARRTSPTNIGLGLLSNLAAWDLGYIPAPALLQRTENTLAALDRLERYEGHFYNWYDTGTLQPLTPLYVSTVDNGNFIGFLLTLQGGLTEMAQQKILPARAFSGLRATLELLKEEVGREWNSRRKRDTRNDLKDCLSELETLKRVLTAPSTGLAASWAVLERAHRLAAEISAALAQHPDEELCWWSQALVRDCEGHLKELDHLAPWIPLLMKLDILPGEVRQRLDAIPTLQEVETLPAFLSGLLKRAPGEGTESLAGQAKDLLKALRSQCVLGAERASQRIQWSETLARRCAELADLDFTPLYDASRDLFSIGYSVSHHRLDATCYDLLASEARLISYVAIARGQLKQEHWFAMGRLLVSQAGVPTLLSWSGSMFEYLMPLLIMPVYEDTLLESSSRGAVARQIEYGRQRGVPWGISESGYNLTDAHLNYQYRAFGVPGLGLKRGLAEDLVIAPYASALALLVAPEEACENLERLFADGREGRYGFYEAVDYTPIRLPPNETSASVQSFMAHHLAMSFLSFNALLLSFPMRRRFHSNPLLKAGELLLQERVPKQTTVLQTEEVDLRNTQRAGTGDEATLRIFSDPSDGPPEVQLLSNGRCHSIVTSAGGGYCRWKDVALTRWQEDATRDCWGSFIYLRDVDRGHVWSPTFQPVVAPVEHYEAVFSQGRAEYRARLDAIDTHLQICISPEDDVEVRHLEIVNHGETRRTIELTSFAEVALNTPAADHAHPAFSKLFVETRILREHHAILCSRRRRAPGEEWPWMFQLLLVDGKERREPSFETDRARFLGRGRTAADPLALDASAAASLSNQDGPVLDPCVSIRRTLEINPKAELRATLITGVAADEAGARALIEKYQDIQLADRAIELSWTHGLVVLRHLNTTEADAQLFGRLAGALVFANPLRRADPGAFIQNRRGQSNLWSYGISGDLPIVLVRVHSAEGLDLVRQLLQAHAYWRLKGLAADLVILNEDDSNYRQSMHDQIMGLIASGMEAQLLDRPGGVFVRRLELVPHEDLILLQAVARVSLSDEKGTLARQLQRRRRPGAVPPRLARPRRSQYPESQTLPPRDLAFFNGYGGFTRDGREYVITLAPGHTTPAPWVNVIANPEFGTVISESGGAYTWSENSHEFRLTPWQNDPVTDASGEAFYIRDERTGYFWSPMPAPARGSTPYVTRHGFGYSVFEHTEAGIASELTIFVAMDAPVKFAVLKLRNRSGRPRSLSVTGYWEWVLGELRHKNLMHVVTEIDAKSQALFARNAFNTDFPDRMAWVDVNITGRAVTGDREEFLGRHGTLTNPGAMASPRLSGKVGAGLDPCAAVRVQIELARDEEREVVFRLGAARNVTEAQQLIYRFREPQATGVALEAVRKFWDGALGTVQFQTPDIALNMVANGWLVYQTLACRLWARTGFYQSGGAFGFRDQLQDVMALVHCQPALVREHLLRAAAHQFHEGDVQHWWHPPVQRGVRTRFSDDFLWLPYATAHYVRTTGDAGVLDEKIPFLESRALRPEEEAFYDLPHPSGEAASLYEHCVRAIKHGLRFGEHGLPLMGCGDWNDGMNLVGIHGRGESVWLAFFLHDVLARFGGLARERNDDAFAKECAAQAAKLRKNVELHAWDGQWYRRAYFDNGEPLGSSVNPECQIDSLPQSWSVIAGVGMPERQATAMNAVVERLVHRRSRVIKLFDPPFDRSALEPGYIRGYLPGVRENGGQYTHAAIWTVMAFALMGEHKRAWDLLSLINPVLHAATPDEVARYKVEPYVVAADVYGAAPHTGRGGWTWYTGSAGWLYRLILEVLLGVEVRGDRLRLTPRLPAHWPECEVRYRFRETTYRIAISRVGKSAAGTVSLALDGQEQSGEEIQLQDDGKEHRVTCRLG